MNACNCSNNGQCMMDNETLKYSCVCNDCTGGEFCEKTYYYVSYSMSSSISIDIMLTESVSMRAMLKTFIIFIFTLLTISSFISNLLTLSTCVIKKIRITICGLYIIVYSTFGFFGIVLLEIVTIASLFYNSELQKHSLIFCTIIPMCVNVASDLSLWLCAFIAVERVLIEFFGFSLYRTRKYAVVFLTILFAFLSSAAVIRGFGRTSSQSPVLSATSYVCSYHRFPNDKFKIAHEVMDSVYLHFVIPLSLSFLSIVVTLTHIIFRKITLTELDRNSWRSLITQQLLNHKHFFIPPLVNIICTLPEKLLTTIAGSYCIEKNKQRLFLRLHIALDFLLYMPLVITFLIYIYPSKVYMVIFNNIKIIEWIRRISCRKSSYRMKEFNSTQVPEETRL